MKLTYTFVPRTLHALQHVYRVRNERIREFLQGRRGWGGNAGKAREGEEMQPERGSTRTSHDQADAGRDQADGE
jgi:hypothetical protein